MRHRTLLAAGTVIVALALLLPTILQAQSPLTLESLSEQISNITDRLDDGERAERRLGAKIAALENRVTQLESTATAVSSAATSNRWAKSTATPTPRPTRKPTATPRPTSRPTATSTACSRSGIPEPPSGFRLNCDAWEVTYQLFSLASGGYVSDSTLPQLASEIYPMVVKADRNCGVGVSRMADMVYAASKQMERLGKPAGGGSAIGYLLGVVSDSNFDEIKKEAGGTCRDAISLIVLLSE